MRAGSNALSLLSVPLNVYVLRALEEEPTSLMDLRRTVGSPPQTTLRGHLQALAVLGIVERRRRHAFPGTVGFELLTPGHDLLAVAGVVQAWLAETPDGPLSLGSTAAKSAVKALVEGWSSGLVRALAARPLSLTELNKLISGISYPSLERRLAAMRMAGQIEPCPGRARGTPYMANKVLRRAIAPLAAAARWERQHASSQSAPIGRMDIEAAFLLTVPHLRLPSDLSGACRLAVETRNGEGEQVPAGVLVGVKEGRVVSCVARLRGDADAWVSGSAAAWLRAVMEQETERLEVGGDAGLAMGLLDALHGDLFSVRQRI